MKRVAMVIQRYLPHVGGAERQLQQLAPRLRALGFDIHIITRHEKGLLPFERIDDIPVHRMASVGPKALAAATFTAAAVAQLTRLQPDLVHAHEILTPSSIAVLSKRINKHLVGIGINIRATDLRPQKDLDYLDQALGNIERVQHRTLFLTTDNGEIQDEFRRRHPRVVVFPKFFHPNTKVGLHMWAIYENRPDLLRRIFEDSLTEVWLLSRCGTLVHQGASTFCRVARLWAGPDHTEIDWDGSGYEAPQ